MMSDTPNAANLSLSNLVQLVLRDRFDLLIGLALMALAGIAAYGGAELLGPKLLIMNPYGDTWFDSDVAAYYSTLADPTNPILHERTYKHPLLSFAFCLPVYWLEALGLNVLVAVRLFIATVAALWLGSLFAFFRLMGCRLPEAGLLSALGGISASGMFWLPILESYPLGSLGLVWALIWLAMTEVRRPPSGTGVFISVVTFGVTITNWLVGWLATGLTYSWQQMLRLNGFAFLIVFILMRVQQILFKSELPFAIPHREMKYVVSSEAGSSWNVVQSFLCHTMVMPAVQVITHPRTHLPMMSTQLAPVGSGSVWGAIAVGLWLGLLALGLWQLFTMKSHLRLRLMLGLSLLGQLGLHLVYTGRETFLYSLHFLPFLLGIAALGHFKTKRTWFIALLITLLISVSWNNVTQFERASAFYQSTDLTEQSHF